MRSGPQHFQVPARIAWRRGSTVASQADRLSKGAESRLEEKSPRLSSTYLVVVVR
jgi:hypothetical protein